MYEDSYQDSGSGLRRVLKAMQASVRVGTFFGVEVRWFWLNLLIPLIILFSFRDLFGHPLVPWTSILALVAAFSLGLWFITYTHEMGHIAAGWRYGIHTPLITLSPVGGLAHLSAPAPDENADIVVSLAGPATHLVWLAVVTPVWWFQDAIFGVEAWEARAVVEFLFQMNAALALFNLLPFYPMDGGRVLSALLSKKMHPNRALVVAAKTGMVGAVLIGVAGVFLRELWGGVMIAIGITNFMACRRAVVAARYQQSPYGGEAAYRAAWETDPDAWKQGGVSYDDEDPDEEPPRERQSGRLQQWLDTRRERAKAELAVELDRILAKINDQGMASLTRAERKTLDRASKQARGDGGSGE